MKKEGYPKSLRIKKKKEWEEIIRKGERFFGQNLLLLRLKTEEKRTKFGIGIVSGFKGAARRNRIKRVLKEVIRKNKKNFLPGEKVVLIYRSKEKDMGHEEILNEFLSLVKSNKKSDA